MSGDRRPRAGFRSPAPGSPWREAPRPTMRPRVNVPYTFPQAASRRRGQKEVGHQGFQTPKWSAVRRDRPIARPVRFLAGAATVTLRHYGAPLPFWEQHRMGRPGNLRRKTAREKGRACPGEVGTGSPSGHASKKRETWLFYNSIGSHSPQPEDHHAKGRASATADAATAIAPACRGSSLQSRW